MTFEEFKQNFLPEFLNIKSFAGKIKYTSQYLTRIGSGSGRIVYDIDGQKVLKLAKNTKGIAQNEAEAGIGYYNDSQHIVTIVYDNADDDSWLIAEKAKKVNEKRIKELTGIPSLNDLHSYLRNHESENKGGRQIFGQDENIKNQLDNNEFVVDLMDFVANYSQHTGDMSRPSSYGEVLRDGQPTIVLTDYGLNDEVYDTYYGPQRKQKYRMYELYNFADGNDDILSDIGNVGQDQRHGMWALMPYGVGDGDGVINEEFKEFIIRRSIYPNKPIKNMPELVDNFHECVNNLKETLNHVDDKKKFYKNLLELQKYLISQNYYDREPLSSEEYVINEDIEQQSPQVQKFTLTDVNYATEIAKNSAEKLGFKILKTIGGGSNGFAFDIGDTKIFKLSADISEADAATKLIRVKPTHLAIVYNLYKIVDTEKNQAFFGIIEQHILDKPIQQFHRYINIINDIMPNNMSIVDFYMMMKKNFDYNNLIDLAKKILTDKSEANISEIERQRAYDWMIGLFEIKKELLGYNIKSDDYSNPENLGYEDNILKFFDFGGYRGVNEPDLGDANMVFLPENEKILDEKYNRNIADNIANQIAKTKGYNEPKYVDAGEYGVAYDIGDDKILKITADNSEAAENLKLINKPLKYIAQPYNVFTIDSKNTYISKTYAIVLEKLKTDPQKFKRLKERIDFIFEKIFNLRLYDIIDYYINGYGGIDTKKIDGYMSKNPEDAEFFYSILRIAEEAKQYGVESLNYLNYSNLGYKKNGVIAFFDVGFSNGYLQPHGAENIKITEDGTSKFSTPNSVGQDNFPPYENNDTSPVTDNNIPTTPESVKEDLEYHHVVGDATQDKFALDEIGKKSFMKGAQAVTVKKKCRLGGLGNTSVACNQGDINNLDIKAINENNLPHNKTFWAWVSPDNKFTEVSKLQHAGFIERKYPELSYDLDALFYQAFRDGWVRVIYEYNPDRFMGTLSMNGFDKERVKSVFKDMFFDLIKYGNNIIYLDYEVGGNADIIRTGNAEGKAKLVNYVNEQSITEFNINNIDALKSQLAQAAQL